LKEESSDTSLVNIRFAESSLLKEPTQFSLYSAIFIREGKGVYHADFGVFPFKGPVILFSTPLQTIFIESEEVIPLTLLQFHGDFYCIEYHHTEVACNGLIFNNVYIEPAIILSAEQAKMFNGLLNEIKNELQQPNSNGIVLKTYLQLFLAKSSNIKLSAIANNSDKPTRDDLMEKFRELLNENYLTLRKPSDYAELLMLSTNNLHKRARKYFNKSPSELIHERIILEAKKQLHLTRASIKEIAYQLNFNDEFYFSRFFKKYTKVSPNAFREKAGTSIVADLTKAADNKYY
jgi:AraC family transcriptional regulator, transcriptional activator of pobA